MPNIKGQDLSGGIKILSGDLSRLDAHYTKVDLENYLSSHSIVKAEQVVGDYLGSIVGEIVRVHIYSVSPLRYNVCVADSPEKIPDNWWEE